ncbi:MAG: hypothetical protein HKN87_15455 [Saprospiraceae bacterium]|nr:hypothetical protein [Saprospiraceae bacterium]
MFRFLLLTVVSLGTFLSCSSQGASETEPTVQIEPGEYKAVINTAGVEKDMRAYAVTSNVSFTFETDQTFIYSVRAMGKEIDDVGKWEIRGDSLHIFDLGKGPNSAFKVTKTEANQYNIDGPNSFTLVPAEEAMTPTQN